MSARARWAWSASVARRAANKTDKRCAACVCSGGKAEERARTAHGEEGGHAAGELGPQRAAALWGMGTARVSTCGPARRNRARAAAQHGRPATRLPCWGARRGNAPPCDPGRQVVGRKSASWFPLSRLSQMGAGCSARARTSDAEEVVDRRSHGAQHLVVPLGDDHLVWRRASATSPVFAHTCGLRRALGASSARRMEFQKSFRFCPALTAGPPDTSKCSSGAAAGASSGTAT